MSLIRDLTETEKLWITRVGIFLLGVVIGAALR